MASLIYISSVPAGETSLTYLYPGSTLAVGTTTLIYLYPGPTLAAGTTTLTYLYPGPTLAVGTPPQCPRHFLAYHNKKVFKAKNNKQTNKHIQL